MEKSNRIKTTQIFIYPNRFIKSIFSLVTGYFLIVRGEYSAYFSIAHFTKLFLINSFLIYQLVTIVYGVNELLNMYSPWSKDYKKRILFQLLFGICAPLLPPIALSIGYFSLQGVDILKASYFGSYIKQVIGIVILINLSLFFRWMRKGTD